jgi:hypothetical protein
MNKKEKKAEKVYSINIPVFVTERKEITSPLFELNYNEVIDNAIKKIEEHNSASASITYGRKNKTIERVVDKIEYTKDAFGDVPFLLLKVSAYNSNVEGEFIKSGEILEIENADKVGSSNNFILLYPIIAGIEPKYFNWMVLVYDDPKKTSDENIYNAKMIMNSILDQPIRNIKLKKFIEELNQSKTLPIIDLNLSSISFEENDLTDKFEVYNVRTRAFRKVEFEYRNMPIDKVEELINEKFDNGFGRKILNFKLGKKVFKLTQNLENFKVDFNSTVEQHFNFTEEITKVEIDKIYDYEVIKSKMERVITEYLTNGEDGIQ